LCGFSNGGGRRRCWSPGRLNTAAPRELRAGLAKRASHHPGVGRAAQPGARIVGLGAESNGKLELTIERFGKRQGCIYLLDGTRGGAEGQRRSARLVFREQFRRSLSRQFPEWQIAELSSEANLEESLSPAYPRALLTSGAKGIAALAAPPEPGAAAASLTFALIWLDYLRRRERRLGVESLALFYSERDARRLASGCGS